MEERLFTLEPLSIGIALVVIALVALNLRVLQQLYRYYIVRADDLLDIKLQKRRNFYSGFWGVIIGLIAATPTMVLIASPEKMEEWNFMAGFLIAINFSVLFIIVRPVLEKKTYPSDMDVAPNTRQRKRFYLYFLATFFMVSDGLRLCTESLTGTRISIFSALFVALITYILYLDTMTLIKGTFELNDFLFKLTKEEIEAELEEQKEKRQNDDIIINGNAE